MSGLLAGLGMRCPIWKLGPLPLKVGQAPIGLASVTSITLHLRIAMERGNEFGKRYAVTQDLSAKSRFVKDFP